jgi:LysR family transcriptional regulator for bpeEF and oprC
MRSLDTLAIFASVAESRSFSAAGRRLGISPSGASKAITRLEKQLGVRLLSRTTRSVKLTEDGAAYFDHCRRILEEIEQADNAVTRARMVPHGRLKVHITAGFGKKIIVPALARFAARYPDITLDIELADRMPDLAEEGIDVSIRVGNIGDSRVVARRLCRTLFITCAAPAYLERYGEPKAPEDLATHRCLAYAVPLANRYREWNFARDGKQFSLALSGPLNINSGEALVDTAIAGGGIVTVASFMAAEALAARKLRWILRDYTAEGPDISITYLAPRQLSARSQAFIDFIVGLIPPDPPWERILTAQEQSRKARR